MNTQPLFTALDDTQAEHLVGGDGASVIKGSGEFLDTEFKGVLVCTPNGNVNGHVTATGSVTDFLPEGQLTPPDLLPANSGIILHGVNNGNVLNANLNINAQKF